MHFGLLNLNHSSWEFKIQLHFFFKFCGLTSRRIGLTFFVVGMIQLEPQRITFIDKPSIKVSCGNPPTGSAIFALRSGVLACDNHLWEKIVAMNLRIIALNWRTLQCSEPGKLVKQVNIFSIYIKLAKLASWRFLGDKEKCLAVRKFPPVGLDLETSGLVVIHSKSII